MSAVAILTTQPPHAPHIPVMLAEVLAALKPRAGGTYIDCTFGAGGYSRAILEASAPNGTIIAIDRDPPAIAGGEALMREAQGRLHLLEGRMGDMAALMPASLVGAIDGIVMDLGVSSMQLDQAARGFSFRFDGPLDMRMGTSGETAADFIARAEEETLADVIHEYGEERLARRIARAIVAARAEAPIETTHALAAIVRRVYAQAGLRDAAIDPATRTFQALRIAVNEELDELTRAIEAAHALLKTGGVLVAVSFHSLEDRIVKNALKPPVVGVSRHAPDLAAAPERRWKPLGAKPLTASRSEAARNPRARSAKLRAAEKLAGGAR
jgi:16S rRNA (cytosine1402-N4)-methyltransferase